MEYNMIFSKSGQANSYHSVSLISIIATYKKNFVQRANSIHYNSFNFTVTNSNSLLRSVH